MRSLPFISIVVVLVGGDRGDRTKKASAVVLEEIPKSLVGKEKKADEGTVDAGPDKTQAKSWYSGDPNQFPLISYVQGPHKTLARSYTYEGMNVTSLKIDVWYPVGVADQKFPLISYAHGHTYGGPGTVSKYGQLLQAMSAFGYVIAAHESCDLGCWPGGMGATYKEQLKVIEWAKQQGKDGETVFKSVNFDIGVGISGHSMGGHATVESSSSHGSGHGIKAAVMHQLGAADPYPAPIVPFLAFTGTEDTICLPYKTKRIFDAKGANPIRGFAHALGGDHLMPQFEWQKLAVYSVAWFKLFLDEIRKDSTADYEAMIFGTSDISLCHGGFGPMAACEVHDGPIASE